MSSNTANISSYTGFNTFKNNFLLEGDESRTFFSHPIYDDFLMVGDPSGNQTTVSARTLEWGVNTVHPDNTPTIAGRMSLPTKWGKNGTFLGINGGIIDWIDAFDTTNNNFFGFANFGTKSIQNKHINTTEIYNFYDSYRYTAVPQQDDLARIAEKQTFTGENLSEVKLSSTIGMFCDASGILAHSFGWQNYTNENFSFLIGSNLEISNNILRSGGTGGEVILGRANQRYEHRDNPTKERILTIANGLITNSRDDNNYRDAYYMTTDGESYFKNTINLSGNMNITGISTLTNDLFVKNSAIDASYVFTSGITSYGVIKTRQIENEEFVTRTTDVDNIGSSSGRFNMISDNGIYFKKYKIVNNNKFAEHADAKLTHQELGKNSFVFDNTGGLQIFTTRAIDKPATVSDSNTNYSEYTTIEHNRAAFGGIQILHPDAYYNTEKTGYDASGIYPSDLKDQFRGCHLTWYGVSGEEMKCDSLNVKGLQWPPSTRNESINSDKYHLGYSDLVLGSKGDGTCEWRAINIDNAVSLNIQQLANVYSDSNRFLFIGRSSESASADASNTFVGIRSSRIIIDTDTNIGTTLTVGTTLNVLGNSTLGSDVNIGANTVIGNNTDIGGKCSIGNYIDVSSNANIDGKTIIKNSLDISGNFKADGNIDVNNIKASGHLDLSLNAVIDGIAIIGDDTYINGNVKVYKDTTIDGDTDISNSMTTGDDIYCGNNIYFKNTEKVVLGTKEHKNSTYTSVFNVISDRVNYAISNSISNPACSIIWFARNSPPENYMVCNGRYFLIEHYPDLSENLPSSVSKIENNAEQILRIKVTDNLTFGDNTTYSFEVVDTVTKEVIDNFTTKNIGLIANSNIKLEIYNSAQNLQLIYIKFTSDSEDISDSVYENANIWSTLDQLPVPSDYSEFTEYKSYNINSSPSNGLRNKVRVEIIIRDENNFEYILYDSNAITGSDDKYIANSQNDFKNRYMKIPNLIGKFCKGGETNIGVEYEDSVKSHKHLSVPHSHDISFTKVVPHTHSALSVFTGNNVENHNHEVAVSYLDINSSSLSTTNADLSMVIMHSTNSLGTTTYKNTSSRGSLTPAGLVTTVIDTTDDNADPFSINFNDQAGEVSLDISGVVDENNQPYAVNETAPKHTVLLPCIALGSTNIPSDNVVMDTYSTAMRLEFIERKLASLDICLNTAAVNVHNF